MRTAQRAAPALALACLVALGPAHPCLGQTDALAPSASSIHELKTQILESYGQISNPHQLSGGGAPTRVKLQLAINALGPINEVNQRYTMDVYFRQSWKDERLQFSNTSGPGAAVDHLNFSDDVAHIWTPDTYLPGSEDVTRFHRQALVWVYPTGEVLWSQRLLLEQFRCEMDFSRLPFDTQYCEIWIESFASDASEIMFEFDDPGLADPGLEGMSTSVFSNFKTVTDGGTYAGLGSSFSFLRIQFSMTRQSMAYIQDLAYAVMFVVMSYTSFWLDNQAVPARIALNVTCVLITITLMQKVKSSLPNMSYAIFINDYMSGCLLFNLVALLSYTLVNVGMRAKSRREALQQLQQAVKQAVKQQHEVPGKLVEEKPTENQPESVLESVAVMESQQRHPPASLPALGVYEVAVSRASAEEPSPGAEPVTAWEASNAAVSGKYDATQAPGTQRKVKNDYDAFWEELCRLDFHMRWLFPTAFILYTSIMAALVNTEYSEKGFGGSYADSDF